MYLFYLNYIHLINSLALMCIYRKLATKLIHSLACMSCFQIVLVFLKKFQFMGWGSGRKEWLGSGEAQ